VGAAPRRRLDVELVERHLADSRQQARELVATGRVTVDGAPADKPSRLVSPAEAVHVEHAGPRFASRGGLKLDGALDRFAVDPRGERWLDLGASTGGFTDCLLQRGAREVVAVDVGRGQLHERLRTDPRVRNLERTHARDLTVDLIGGPTDGAVADLSFISLRRVVPTLLALVAPGGPLVVLVKPQFEAGRAEASRGKGVIRDPAVWAMALEGVIDAATAGGASIMGAMVSPLRGAQGNVEFFVHLHCPGGTSATAPANTPTLVAAVVAEAEAEVGGESP
jgi:23S rRNA (cytidine1920-2'-O)/16S rRNA (cytidine1409-2'-O)-methyltransferase